MLDKKLHKSYTKRTTCLETIVFIGVLRKVITEWDKVNKINNLEKWFFVLAISITLIVWLFLVDSTDDKTLLWARYTARISFSFHS